MNTENLKKLSEKLTKDNLALIVGGVFVLGLVFSAYNYFNDSTNQVEQNNDLAQEIISSSDERNKDDQKDKMPSEQSRDGVIDLGYNNNVWTANDYEKGDIEKGTYTVVAGDTLWEIAEAVYGNGADWVKILDANSSNVGFLPNGQQALIFSGQTLVLP